MNNLYIASVVCYLYSKTDRKPLLLNEAIAGLVQAISAQEAETRVRKELPKLADTSGYDIRITDVCIIKQDNLFMPAKTFSPAFILSEKEPARTEKLVLIQDGFGIVAAINVKNYDARFEDALANANTVWQNSDNTWEVVAVGVLRNAGYDIEILDYENMRVN